ATASPQAARLAAYIAVSVPTLPVMRLIQQRLLRDPRPGHLAEVLLSGLLRPAVGHPAVFEFIPGAREELLATLPRSESWYASAALARFSAEIESRADRTGDVFGASPQVSSGAGDHALGVSQPFALVHESAIRSLRRGVKTPPPQNELTSYPS